MKRFLYMKSPAPSVSIRPLELLERQGFSRDRTSKESMGPILRLEGNDGSREFEVLTFG